MTTAVQQPPMTDLERHAYADWHVRKAARDAGPGSWLALHLTDYDAMSLKLCLADVENARMRAELTARSAA